MLLKFRRTFLLLFFHLEKKKEKYKQSCKPRHLVQASTKYKLLTQRLSKLKQIIHK
jgi:hypothetical protein